MQWSCIVLALAFVTQGEGLLRGTAENLELEVSGDWAALSEAESEDRNFLLSQIDQTEKQLVQLLKATGQSGDFAGLQISAAPVDKKAAAVTKPASADAKKVATVAKKEEAKKVATVAKKEDKEDDNSINGIKLPSLASVKGMKGAMALAPMLAMLKGLYQDSKDRISQQNVREAKSKKWFTEKEADHKAKIDAIEGKFKNHTLSEEFRTNETRDETRYFSYWSRCRERQHRQFHTNLKIQHAMMMKVKKMVDMYENALSTKAGDQTKAKKQLGQMTGMPEIVFLQDVQRTVGKFCRESLTEVRKERTELQEQANDVEVY